MHEVRPVDDRSRDDARSSPPFIAALTGIRAVMGAWVVADHVFPPLVKLLPEARVLRFALSGGIALDTFFILSGFVISHTYAHRVASPDRRRYAAFVWARITRLYPTHLVALLAMAALVPAFDSQYGDHFTTASDLSPSTFAGNVLMLQAVPGVEPWNPPSWAVSTEMVAYLFFPLAATAIARLSRRRAVVGAVVLVGVLGLALGLLRSPSVVALVATWWVRPLGEFALGCLLWAAWRHGVRAHRRWDLVAVAAFAGVLLVLWTGRYGVPQFVAVPLLGLVVVGVAGSAGLIRRLMTTRFLQWAGRTSYSRYLMHVPVLMLIGLFLPVSLFVAFAAPWFRVALVALWFVATFAVGALTYRFVERPAQRWLRNHGPTWSVDRTDPDQDALGLSTSHSEALHASARTR